jgi:hypothetical protein
MKGFIFHFCVLSIAILFAGCGVSDVYYKPDVIVAQLDAEVARKVKTNKQPALEENNDTYSITWSPRTGSTFTKSELVSITDSEIEFGNYYALVIGINHYPYLKDLQTAKNDARSVAHILKNDYGFEVRLMTDPTRSEIISALNYLRGKLTSLDNLLIYYAGHGWLDEKADEGYWLPSDATSKNEANWISNSTITTSIKTMVAKHIMVVADSCYSGKLIRGIHINVRTPDYLARISKKTARVVLTAGGLEPVIDSGVNERHSVFASAFIKTLLGNQGVMDGTELFGEIRRQVILNSDQVPEYSDLRKAGHDGGDFIFVRKQESQPKPPLETW